MIVLVGFMGAGKTTVGARLADRLGRPFIDTDAEIERSVGATIPEIFATRGERGFRELERAVVDTALSRGDGIMSLGGGALSDPVTRAALEWQDVVFLDVSFTEAMRRIAGTDRPMLRNTDAKALYDERQATYASAAGMTVTTNGREIDEIVEDLSARFATPATEARVRVHTTPGYDVIIGSGLIERSATLLAVSPQTTKAALITHPGLRSHAQAVARSLSSIRSTIFEVPAGEDAKRLEQAADLYDAFTAAGLRRNDLVVGVGGGVICDLAGFVASTYHRGISVAHVPTSLLAQVDAAIGGKTAVNLSAGKNLVGTFHQPIGVLCDIATLETLPAEEFRSGLAEVAKAGFIADPGLIELLETRADGILERDPELLSALVVRSVGIKASVVAADERDAGMRAILNYGHTIGHALEHAGRSLRHGESVSLGMMAAAYLAHERGFVEEDVIERHRNVLTRLGLPVAATVMLDEIEPFLLQDKKGGEAVRFVLLKRIGVPVTGIEVPRDALERALKRMDT